MNLKSSAVWILFIVLTAPFIAYGAGQFMPFYDSFVVTSGSMEPEIQTGALLFTHMVPADQISVGDTITFKEDGEYTTHKVIEKNLNPVSFKTQGTANSAPDPGSVTEDELAEKNCFQSPTWVMWLLWPEPRWE